MFNIWIFITNLFKIFIRLFIAFIMFIVVVFYYLFKIIGDSFTFLEDKSEDLFDYIYDKSMKLPLECKYYEKKINNINK